MKNSFCKACLYFCMMLLTCCLPLNGQCGDPMVLVFNTAHSEGTTITLPLEGRVMATVHWGDGSEVVVREPGLLSHTYTRDGQYTITVTGQLEQFGLGHKPYPNVDKLTRVISFGDLGITSLSGAFRSSDNLTGLPDTLPETVKDLSFMFASAGKFNLELNHWNVGNVENMSYLFYQARTFNQPLDHWDVGRVETMAWMFSRAVAFNQPIGSWNVSNVRNMAGMFNRAGTFNQPLDNWDVGRVETMGRMFLQATAFNQPIGSWNVSNVRDMGHMFWLASSFDQPLAAWDVRNVKNMGDIFTGRFTEANYDDLLISWAALPLQPYVMFSGGQNHYRTIEGKEARKRLAEGHQWMVFDGSGSSVSAHSPYGKVIGQGSYLEGDTVTLVAIPDPGLRFSHWEGYGVESARDSIFSFVADDQSRRLLVHWERKDKDVMVLEVNTHISLGRSVTLPLMGEVDLAVDWGDGKVQEITSPGLITHRYCHEGIYHIVLKGTLEQFGNGPLGYDDAEKLIGVEQFGTLGLKSLSGAFYGSSRLSKMPLDFPATVTDVSFMFYGVRSVPNSVTDLDMGNVTNMQSMFEGSGGLFLSPANWDVSNVTNMTDMFKDQGIVTPNYNRLLIQWAELPLQDSVHLDAGNSQYSLGEAAEARQRIIDTFHWTISDGGDDGRPLPPPIDFSTMEYDSIARRIEHDDPFSDYLFVTGNFDELDHWDDAGVRLFLLNPQKEFVYASPGMMDIRSLRVDKFRETNEGFLPVREIDPEVHYPVEGSPMIILMAGGDEHGYGGSSVFIFKNDNLLEVGDMNVIQYSVNHWLEKSYKAIGEFVRIERQPEGLVFRFDTDRIAFYEETLRSEQILDASSCYYLFDGEKLEFIREE